MNTLHQARAAAAAGSPDRLLSVPTELLTHRRECLVREVVKAAGTGTAESVPDDGRTAEMQR
jgi:hypothetical protein